MDPKTLAMRLATLPETTQAIAKQLLEDDDELADSDLQQLDDAALDLLLEATTEPLAWADAHNAALVSERVRSAREGFTPDKKPYDVAAGDLKNWLQFDAPDASSVTFVTQWTCAELAGAVVEHAHVRVIGERHADTPLANPGTNTLVVVAEGGPGEPARFGLRADAPRHRWVPAGMQIAELIPELAAKRLALANIGSFSFQTFGGVFNAGTHGSGLTLGCMADEVLSVDLVTGEGRLVRVERDDGPTDPGSVPAGWQLVQNTQTFHHAVVSVGMFGVAVGYNVRLYDEIILDERVKWTTFEDAIGGFDAAAKVNRYAEIYINPYDRVAGAKHRALVILRHTVDDVAPDGSYVVIDRTKPSTRKKLRRRKKVVDRAKLTAKGEFRARLTVGMALRYLRHGEPLVGPWWEILRRDTFVRAHGFEVFVPASDAKTAGETLLATIAAKSRFEGPGVAFEQAVVANTPIGMRVIQSSAHTLAMTHGDYVHNGQTAHTAAWVSFEVPRLVGTPNPDALPRAICNALGSAGIFFRTHWGQYAPTAGLPAVSALYPSFTTWSAVRSAFDPNRRFVTPDLVKRGF